MNYLDNFFKAENTELYSLINFDLCNILNEEKMKRSIDFIPRSVIIIAIPYYTGLPEKTNLSLYAMSKDYHIYMNDLLSRLRSLLLHNNPGFKFKSFSDSSPIDERLAASRGGLGVIGDNGMLITQRYGSYVFIGEIISDMDVSLYPIQASCAEIKKCRSCGRCKLFCPYEECSACLSELTQRKGELNEHDFEMMKKYNTVWGCDICQTVCPLNYNVEKTPISFFYEDRITYLTQNDVKEMSEESFKMRAFSWRGRKTLLRNLEKFEE